MQPLLYLTHRIPFPPDKGDKVRSFHLLQQLASSFEVHLGTFIDDPADIVHLDKLNTFCASVKAVISGAMSMRLRSASGFFSGEALSVSRYRDPGLAAWVGDAIDRHRISKAVVFSSAMAQYIPSFDSMRVVVDFVDVDSSKWAQYATARAWPMSALFAREAKSLLAFERRIARSAHATFFVTPAEAELFRALAPETSRRLKSAENGVNADYFAPSNATPRPFPDDEDAVVFTGAMDYWPNVDAASWFARDVMPHLLSVRPKARFYVVGRNPSSAVRSLSSLAHVVVTGGVADVRPYLQHARAVVAPLRIARGIQNKVLEAMSMARPVVTTSSAAAAIAGEAGRHFVVADERDAYVEAIDALMDTAVGNAIGRAARQLVVARYDWATNLQPILASLQESPAGAPPAGATEPARVAAL